MGMGAPAPAAFYAICWNGGSGALGCPAANGALDDLSEAGHAPLLVPGETFRANLDAIDEGTVLVQPFEGLSWWCPWFVKVDFVVLGQHALLFFG